MYLKPNTLYKKMKILVVSGFFPYPPVFGGAIDVWERIKGLNVLGCTVDLVVTDKVNPTQQQLQILKQHIRHFFFVRRKNHISQMFGNLPLQLLSRKNLSVVEINQDYDLVILESEFCWPVTLNKSITYKNIAVRVHNVESHYFKMLGKSSDSFKEKIYYKIEAAKIRKLSALVFSKADRLWFISKNDLDSVNLPGKSRFMPFPINETFVKPDIKEGNNVVFMGSLFMQNNLFGLDWYLKNVHPYLTEAVKNYHFYIIGSLKEEDAGILAKYGGLPHVSLVINTPCLKSFYSKASVFVNPMLHGSGVKVKSVNALVNGVPLVSTAVGAEGIGLTHDMYFHAEDTETFRQQVLNVLENVETALKKTRNAQEYLKEINYLDILKRELDEFN